MSQNNKMYYDSYRVFEVSDTPQCVSLQTSGKIIGILEVLFHVLVYFPLEEQFKHEPEKLIILAVILGFLAFFGLSLLYGSSTSDRLYVTPWLWVKYGIIIVQVMRFIFVIIGMSFDPTIHAGASTFFEFLYFAYNVFIISIVREYVNELEEIPYTIKQFHYYRV